MRIYSFLAFVPFFSLLISTTVTGQLNMLLQDSLTYAVGVNDVCGWVAPDGREYALVGLNTGVSIVDINEDSLRQVAFVPGENNLWRDINTYGHYAYVSSEARIGLLIIDLQFLPDSVQTYVWEDELPTVNGPRPFEKAHTLWVDENGICYLNGSNHNNGGVVLIDVATNPTHPTFLGYAPAIYSHDCYARDSIIYSAEIYAGNLSIYDARDPQNIFLIGRVKTPTEFTHNAWLSDDSRHVFTTDERANSFVTAYNIEDPSNPIEVDRYRHAPTAGAGDIPHNVYVWNDWLVVAYYSNGTTIVDASRPDNLVEVGNFDTYFGPHGGFPGVWGSYPFLPSGKILSSDRNSGLYVFIPNYVRACFLEGTVIDSVTRAPLFNAIVTIESDEILLPELTRFDGQFKTGKAIPGVYNIRIKKEGYYDKVLVAEFINGEILEPLVELVPLPTYTVAGLVIDESQTGVPFAKVLLAGPEGIYETDADENGVFVLPPALSGNYELQAGVWGQTYETEIELTTPLQLTLQLERGYYDDFDLDLGWTVSGQVTSGEWLRGYPTQQTLLNTWICGSGSDSPNDLGGRTYSTGLSSTSNVIEDDVSGGTTWLASPAIDFTSLLNPKVTFDFWLCEFPPETYVGLSVWVTNGVDTFLLEQLRNDSIAGSWQTKTYTDLNVPEPLEAVRFLFSASDTTTGANDYILKAHIDRFQLTDITLSSNEVPDKNRIVNVFPNPVYGPHFFLTSHDQRVTDFTRVNIFDLQGRLVSTQPITPGDAVVQVALTLQEGLYLVQWMTLTGMTGIEKVSVIR